ncbi:MAG: hypothetical protein ACR2PY_06605 [Salinispira sp.]
MSAPIVKASLPVCFFLMNICMISAQVDFNELNFQDAFREGVVFFHRGNFNESILSLQKSLGFIPDNYRAREWLGRAYYFSGYEDAALNEWRRIESRSPPFLRSFIESIEARRSLAEELGEDRDFLIIEEFTEEEFASGVVNPGAVMADGNGNFFINSFGTNNINHINQNGQLLRNLAGGLKPLSGPFDIAIYEDRLYVTNFLGDYISVLNSVGNTITTFGSAGIAEGEFLGPQYLSISEEPALYVSDVGNQRVTKFTLDGTFLFHFGEPPAFRNTPEIFEGFSGIGGLAAGEDGIYVADNLPDYSELLYFDKDGNVLERFVLDEVSMIEDLTLLDDGSIVITSRTTVYMFNPENLSVEVLYGSNENVNAQFVSAGFDDNNNLLISDFRNNRILFLSRLSGVYSGYQVEIHRIDASDFPNVFVELSVRDALGNDIIGLQEENLVFTENGFSAGGHRMEYSGSFDTVSSVAFIIEASGRRNDLEFQAWQNEGVFQALELLPEDSEVRIFSAGLSPVMEYARNSNPADIPAVMRSMSADREWKLDLAIRLAGDRLLLDQSKREIIFVSSGRLPDWAFDTIGLSETLAYLRNNHIRFNVIDSSPLSGDVDPALKYLVENTGGNTYIINRTQGIGELGQDLLQRRTGLYIFGFKSGLENRFGREYLPLEVEVVHFTKSGRDELGYFSPLEF